MMAKECIQTSDTAQRSFHNALRILMNVETGDLPFLGEYERCAFFSNPHLFFIRADDATCDRLWALIQERQPERYREVG